MRRVATPTPPDPGMYAALALLFSALLLSIVSGTVAVRFAWKLPAQQLRSLSSDAGRAAGQAEDESSQESRDGHVLKRASALTAQGLVPGQDPSAIIERLQCEA